ncbi:MAG: hypothetical protein EXR62_15335 [Chloroflexi bacterium]|nr:hypothetical protein [Chloroflexota bacterium]
MDEEYEQHKKLKAELGIPDEADCFQVKIPWQHFGKGWLGYWLQCFGPFVDVPAPGPWKYLRIRGNLNEEDFVVQFWQQQIYYLGLPVYGEILWHPERGYYSTSIKGLEKLFGTPELYNAIRIAYKGLRLMEGWIRGGRPVGTGYYKNAEDFRDSLYPTIRALLQQGKSATRQEVAEMLNCDDSQLGRWVKNFLGMKWVDVRQEVQKNPL